MAEKNYGKKRRNITVEEGRFFSINGRDEKEYHSNFIYSGYGLKLIGAEIGIRNLMNKPWAVKVTNMLYQEGGTFPICKRVRKISILPFKTMHISSYVGSDICGSLSRGNYRMDVMINNETVLTNKFCIY